MLEAGGWRGLFLLGHRPYRPGLGEEELNAIRLLVEQFGVTLRNRELWQRPLVAERRALEQERLSTLGLLTSCLAHERALLGCAAQLDKLHLSVRTL